MFNFDEMAKNLQQNIHTGGAQQYQDDTRFWKISKDENGKGAAIIRLIPDKNLVPYIKMFHYGLKKPNPMNPSKNMWYIARSPDTIGLPDPVKEYYMSLVGEKTKESQELAKKFSRQTEFIANIIVVKDPANPENNGKVFLWKFGTKLLSKFNSWLNPSEQELAMEATPMNIFHPIDGYNITLKIRPDQHSYTYDDTIIVPKPCSIHESVIDEDGAFKYITSNTYELSEFLKPEAFESYEALKVKFDKYMGNATDSRPAAQPTTQQPRSTTPPVTEPDEMPDWATDKPAAKPSATESKKLTPPAADDDDWLNEIE